MSSHQRHRSHHYPHHCKVLYNIIIQHLVKRVRVKPLKVPHRFLEEDNMEKSFARFTLTSVTIWRKYYIYQALIVVGVVVKRVRVAILREV